MAAANPLPFPETHTHLNSAPEQATGAETAPWCAAVLDLLAEGASITAAMRHVGYSVSAFHKTCKRHPEFRLAANRARNAYRAKVAEDFHESEAYARMLVDAVQRDEQLPASLRLRAALAILNRKPDRWLPSPILAPDDPVDTVDTLDALAELAYRQLLAEFPDEEDYSQPDLPNPDGQATHGQTTRGAMETIDTLGTTDKVDTMDKVATPGTMHTSDKTSAENSGTHRGIAETAALMRIRITPDTKDPVSSADTVDKLDPKPPAALPVESTCDARTASPNSKQNGECRSVHSPEAHPGVQDLAALPRLPKAA